MSRPVLTTSGLYLCLALLQGKCKQRQLSLFWEELTEKYLLPLEKDPAKEKKIQGELIELRNTTCLFFFLINCLFAVLVSTLQYVAQNSSNLNIKVTLLPLAFSLRVQILLFCGYGPS